MLILLFLCFKYDKLLNMNSPAFDSAISGHGHDYRHGSRSSRYAQLLFVLLALSLVIFFRDAPQFHTLGIIFVSIVLEALPFMLLGTLIGGFIEVFIPREKSNAMAARRPLVDCFHWGRNWRDVSGLRMCDRSRGQKTASERSAFQCGDCVFAGRTDCQSIGCRLNRRGVFRRLVHRDASDGVRVFHRCWGRSFNGSAFY